MGVVRPRGISQQLRTPKNVFRNSLRPRCSSGKLESEKLEKAGTVDFKKKNRTEGQDKVQAVSRFPAGLPFPVPQILEFVAFRDSGKFFQQFCRDFPGVFLGNPRTDPGDSHSLSSSFLIECKIMEAFLVPRCCQSALISVLLRYFDLPPPTA